MSMLTEPHPPLMIVSMQWLTMRLRSGEGESMACAIVVAAPCRGALALWLVRADCTNCVTFSCPASVPPGAAAEPSSCFSALLTAAPTSSPYFKSRDLQEIPGVSHDTSQSGFQTRDETRGQVP